jgi:hypothetical protein
MGRNLCPRTTAGRRGSLATCVGESPSADARDEERGTGGPERTERPDVTYRALLTDAPLTPTYGWDSQHTDLQADVS